MSTPIASSTQSAGLTASQAVTGLCVVGGALAAASIGGIGIVGGGIAFGLSSLELGALGAGAGWMADRRLKRAVRSTSSPKKTEPPTTDYEEDPQDIRDLRRGEF